MLLCLSYFSRQKENKKERDVEVTVYKFGKGSNNSIYNNISVLKTSFRAQIKTPALVHLWHCVAHWVLGTQDSLCIYTEAVEV